MEKREGTIGMRRYWRGNVTLGAALVHCLDQLTSRIDATNKPS